MACVGRWMACLVLRWGVCNNKCSMGVVSIYLHTLHYVCLYNNVSIASLKQQEHTLTRNGHVLTNRWAIQPVSRHFHEQDS